MASVQTSSYGGRYLKLTVIEESTSIDDNTSTLKWTLESLSGAHDYYSVYGVTVKINNVTVYGPTTKEYSTHQFPAAKGSTSGTVPIEHNADGTANPVPFSLRGSVYNNNPQTYSNTLPLTTIPRASAIGVINVDIGSSTNITINKASDSFTTTLWYKATGQNDWTKIVDKTNLQGYAWIVPTSFYTLIPDSPTIVCEFKADTYSDNTLIGTTTTSATFTATGSPIINSLTITTDSLSQSLTDADNIVIKGVSDVYFEVNASAQNSASIVSYIIEGTTQSTNSKTIYDFMYDNIGCVVIDSRGYPTNAGVVLDFIEYINLTLNATITRNSPTDGKVNISYKGNYYDNYFSVNNHNSLAVQYRYVEKGQSFENVSWINLSPTIDSQNNTYSQTNYQISNIDYTKQYDFQIKATDACQSVIAEGITVPKGKPIFNWEEDKFNVYGNIYQNETLLSNIFLALSGGTISGDLDVTGALKQNGVNLDNIYLQPTGGSNLTLSNTLTAKDGIFTDSLKVANKDVEIRPQILWENSDTTVSFTSQQIILNSSNYNYLIIIYKYDNSADLMMNVIVPKGHGARLQSFSVPSSTSYTPYLSIRDITYTDDTTLNVGNCESKRGGIANSYATVNTILIPVMILGIL